jgi:hypothetical protein
MTPPAQEDSEAELGRGAKSKQKFIIRQQRQEKMWLWPMASIR